VKTSSRVVLLAVLVAGELADVDAQVHSRSTPPPDRTAVDEAWYASREPIFVNGSYYEPAGASVFFDANTMVPTARLDGVPIYADTTLEPHSLVFVPIGRGLLQPYERRRTGDLAGTTGSRAPSFPVDLAGSSSAGGTRPARERFVGTIGREEAASAPLSPTRGPECAVVSRPHGRVWTALPPVDSRGIWIRHEGRVWKSDGAAARFDAGRFLVSGHYEGFPLYRTTDDGQRVYLPGAEGFLTPYRRTDTPAR